jgi:tRNA A-37 threonylcarbamoyl transferase component Bud32
MTPAGTRAHYDMGDWKPEKIIQMRLPSGEHTVSYWIRSREGLRQPLRADSGRYVSLGTVGSAPASLEVFGRIALAASGTSVILAQSPQQVPGSTVVPHWHLSCSISSEDHGIVASPCRHCRCPGGPASDGPRPCAIRDKATRATRRYWGAGRPHAGLTMMAHEPPTFIGRYQIQRRLGQGAMGIVYKARDPQLDRIVAIKTLRKDLALSDEHYAAYEQRFLQEARAAGRLNHPHLVAIYDVMEVQHTPYIVMECVETDTLANLIKTHGALPPRRVVGIVRQACLALEHAHAHGVVHRDIKPANILFSEKGDVKVGDFGIARIEGHDLTLTGVCLGTPSYMSPEQIRGRPVDGRSDLFSLGAVLYEALAGERPFTGGDTITILQSIMHDEPVPLHERNPLVPARLSAVTARALAKDREQRYPNARAFADALDEIAAANSPDGPGPPVSGQRSGRLRTRGCKAAFIGACLVLVATAAGFTVWRHAASPGVTDMRAGPGSGAATETPPPERTSASELKGDGDGALAVTRAPAEPLSQEAASSTAATPSAPVDVSARSGRPAGDQRAPRDGRDRRTAAVSPRPAGAADPRPQMPPSPGSAVAADPGVTETASQGVTRSPVDTRPEMERQYTLRQERSERERPVSLGPPTSSEPPGASNPVAPPVVPRGEIAGRWQGRYQCQRDEIGFLLSISGGDGNRIAAVFEFFPLPGTLSFPRGSFNMSGEYDPANGSIRLRSAGWIQRPLGFQSHDIEGQVEPNGERISGRVLTTGCADFILARR